MTHHAIPRGRHASALTDAERFWLRVEKTTTCWLWRDPSAKSQYGKFKPADGRQMGAHRFAYELLVGPIPEGLHIDHLCRTPACVNPDHLEPVTPRENLLRGDTINASHASQTSCVNGHPFTEENTLLRRAGGRACRACNRDRNRRYRARQKGQPCTI